MSAEPLIRARAAYIAGWTDHRVRDDDRFGVAHSELISLADFRAFAHHVWRALDRSQPLYVSRIEDLPQTVQVGELADVDASARWETPPADSLGLPRTGELAGTTGIVGYLDVADSGMCRLVALHEIAHLICDTQETLRGHDDEWRTQYEALIENHLGLTVACLWRVEHDWWCQKAAEKIAEDPNWLADFATGQAS